MEDLYTSPVPTKIMGSSLRHTKSEENLTGGEQSNISTSDSQQNSAVRQTPVKNISPYSVRNTDVAFNFPDDDPNDCWSQEDDEITQQVCILFKQPYISLILIYNERNSNFSICFRLVFTTSQAKGSGHHITTESRIVRQQRTDFCTRRHQEKIE